MMKFQETTLKGVYVIDNFNASDNRGQFVKIFNENIFKENNINFEMDGFVNTSAIWVSEVTGLDKTQILSMLECNSGSFIEGPVSFISEQFLNSTSIIFSALITGVLAFLLLLYRTAFKNFLIFQIAKENRKEAKESLIDIRKVSKQYVIGLLKVMLVLGSLNSLGLWIIGVKFPMFWGFFAAILTIVPFVGTFVGGLLPFIFAIVTTTTLWQPIAVVVMFLTIRR